MLNAVARKVAGLREMLFFSNRVGLMVDRLLYPQARTAVYRFGRLEVTADRFGGDLNSLRACLATPMYRQLLPNVTAREINVLDIGAHIGGFSLLLLSLGYRIANLVAVELNPNTALRLEHNLRSNLIMSTTRVRTIAAGVWAAPGELRRNFGWGNTGEGLAAISAVPTAVATVPLRTLDDIIEAEFGSETVDLCKIDLEGAEHQVLASETCKLLRQVRTLVIEVHWRDPSGHEDVLSALRQKGFRMTGAGTSGPDQVYAFENEDMTRP